MLRKVTKKIPQLLEVLVNIRKELPEILNILIELGYITEIEKEKIVEEFDALLIEVSSILSLANYLINYYYIEIGITTFVPQENVIIRVGKYYKTIKTYINNIPKRIDAIENYLAPFMEILIKGGEAHTMKKVIEGLGIEDGKEFKNGDLIIKQKISGGSGAGAKHIEVNISSAVRLYTYGISFVEQKERLLQELMIDYEEIYLNDYERRKRTILDKIHDMERYPYRYQHLLGQFSTDAKTVYRITHIRVNEDIPQLPHNGFRAVFDNIFEYIHKEIQTEREMLKEFENAIKSLVQEESTIAQELIG